MKIRQITQRIISPLLLISYAALSALFIFKLNLFQGNNNLYLYMTTLTTLCFILIIHICISSHKSFVIAIGCVFLFLFCSEITYFIYYKEPITEGLLDSIIETNNDEAFSMKGKVLIVVAPALIVTLFILFIIKKNKPVKFNPFIPIIFYMVGLIPIIYAWNLSSIKDEYKRGHYKGTASVFRNYYPAVVGDLVYLLIGYTTTDIYSSTHIIDNFNEAVLLPPEEPNNQIIVLIMGESSLFKRYSTYGYEKQTTPLMTEIFSQHNACIINNVHSAASFTRDSLAMTLSFGVPENNDNLFDNKSIIEMAQFNNYKTYWIGAQTIKGSFNTKYGFIARKSDVVILTDDGDINLNKLLDKNLQDNSTDKKFFFIHLRGNHQPYNNYSQIDRQALPDADDYDLTIHQTDRIVKSIYDIIKKHSNNYTIIYTSDHGENVGISTGHGMMKGIDQFLIPFMFISTNSKYDCQFIESFRGSTGYLSGLMNKYILSNLLGYKIDRDIIDKEKSNDRVLMANGSVIPFSKVEPLPE